MIAYIPMIAAVVLLGADQLIKWWAVTVLQPIKTIPIIEGALHLTYHENTGAAFSILSEHTTLLSIITGVFLCIILYIIFSKKFTQPLMVWGLCLVVSGGFGNLIDRVFRSFVVDYIDFRLINFAVFNLADCCVVIGTALIIIYVFISEGKQKRHGRSL